MKKSINILFLYFFLFVYIFQSISIYYRLDKLEKCDPEYYTHIINIGEYETYKFPLDTEYLCEDGVAVDVYDTLGKIMIWGYKSEKGKSCVVRVKNVC